MIKKELVEVFDDLKLQEIKTINTEELARLLIALGNDNGFEVSEEAALGIVSLFSPLVMEALKRGHAVRIPKLCLFSIKQTKAKQFVDLNNGELKQLDSRPVMEITIPRATRMFLVRGRRYEEQK